jgi:hypothetical protein
MGPAGAWRRRSFDWKLFRPVLGRWLEQQLRRRRQQFRRRLVFFVRWRWVFGALDTLELVTS